MAPPELPAWARIILIVFTTLSFLPQLHKLIASRDSSGVSPYYVLSNLLLATNHFTIYLAFCVNDPSGGGVVVHNSPNTADFLNLTHVFVVWLLFSLVYSEAEQNETDCGYGDNVVVHAASGHGTNYLVTMIKNKELEAVSIAEASIRILWESYERRVYRR
ncbi:hypothetical protein BJX63DRAFT_106893 [Aspergillus granulosus]|uniref:Uncharacterized protein n=1 Tax=Aspergillus granulosus TaxID=176169 RepID=A0ABR4GU19_9EURO